MPVGTFPEPSAFSSRHGRDDPYTDHLPRLWCFAEQTALPHTAPRGTPDTGSGRF